MPVSMERLSLWTLRQTVASTVLSFSEGTIDFCWMYSQKGSEGSRMLSLYCMTINRLIHLYLVKRLNIVTKSQGYEGILLSGSISLEYVFKIKHQFDS